MNKHNIVFIGLDTHKVSTEVAHIEDQRGAKTVHQGKTKTTKAAITKCGNGRARRLLIEGAQTYKHNANVSTELQKRQETLPKVVIDIA